MSWVRYSVGVFLALIVSTIGVRIYMEKNDLDSVGLKFILLGSVMFAAIVWPVSMPVVAAYILKAAAVSLFTDIKDLLTGEDE